MSSNPEGILTVPIDRLPEVAGRSFGPSSWRAIDQSEVAAFAERRQRLVHALSAFLPEWRPTDSAGGTSVWLEGPKGTDAAELAEELHRLLA